MHASLESGTALKKFGKQINKLLGHMAGIHISRAIDPCERKKKPIPMVASHATRLLYFFDLMLRIRGIEGDIVECGIGAGRSLFYFCMLMRLFSEKRNYFGFDSFEGFPAPHQMDEPERTGVKKGHYNMSQDTVLTFLGNSGIDPVFIKERVHLIPGFFSESLSKASINRIALLHLDVDLYSSYKETMEFFYPKVCRGGVIAFDEYQSEKYPGARKAIDGFFRDREPIQKSQIFPRHFVIKE